jgi:uncharacterized RDD family membrane protein YckC
MKYAGFWKRFAASFIDAFLTLIPCIFLLWLQTVSRPLAFLSQFLITFIFYIYEIYFHGSSGQTIGKRNQNIRVVSLDGSPVSWKQAFLRSSIGLGLSILNMLSVMVALSRIPSEGFSLLGWSELTNKQAQLAPYNWELFIIMQVWAWSEIVVMLFNRKRRALHDFIAGTVVVDESYQALETETIADARL